MEHFRKALKLQDGSNTHSVVSRLGFFCGGGRVSEWRRRKGYPKMFTGYVSGRRLGGEYIMWIVLGLGEVKHFGDLWLFK